MIIIIIMIVLKVLIYLSIYLFISLSCYLYICLSSTLKESHKTFRVQGDFTYLSLSVPYLFIRKYLREGVSKTIAQSLFCRLLRSAGITVVVFLRLPPQGEIILKIIKIIIMVINNNYNDNKNNYNNNDDNIRYNDNNVNSKICVNDNNNNNNYNIVIITI